MLRSRARLCSLRPRAEAYAPQPISAVSFGFVVFFLFFVIISEGFFYLYFLLIL
jgi:hypothetical protein